MIPLPTSSSINCVRFSRALCSSWVSSVGAIRRLCARASPSVMSPVRQAEADHFSARRAPPPPACARPPRRLFYVLQPVPHPFVGGGVRNRGSLPTAPAFVKRTSKRSLHLCHIGRKPLQLKRSRLSVAS